MRVFISIDLEGCAGVVHVDQTRRSGHDYERARRLMSREANAAALGAFDAGASCVIVNDSHGDMRNLLFEELDSRVEIVSGALKPMSMVQGVEAGRADAAFFVGYHSGAGTRASVLDHTYYGAVVSEVRLHPEGAGADDPGMIVDETAINALVVGELGTPLALVTGDEALTRSVSERFLGVTTVAVKDSITRYSARSLHPDEACRRIRRGAIEALEQLDQRKPYVLPTPLGVTFSLLNAGFADAAEIIPGVVRIDARRVYFLASSAREMLRALLSVTMIASTVAV